MLFQSFEQFEIDGCENCEEFLRVKGNKDQVYDCTSNNFDGLIAVMSPEDSWVCKWQRISKLKVEHFHLNMEFVSHFRLKAYLYEHENEWIFFQQKLNFPFYLNGNSY